MGSAQGSREVESETKETRQGAGTGGNAAQGGGRPRCVWWLRCTLCGCAALRSAHLTSRQTVTRRTLGIRRGWIYFCPSRPLTRSKSVVNLPELFALRPIGSSVVGPVVALAEQNAIDLAPAVVASSYTFKESIGGTAAEGQTEAPRVSMSDLSYWRAGSGRVLGGAMALAPGKSRKGLVIR